MAYADLFKNGGGTISSLFGDGQQVAALGANETLLAPVTVSGGAATSVPLSIHGASGQSSDLQQWQDSTGAVKARVNAAGDLSTNSHVFCADVMDSAALGSYLSMTTGAVTLNTRSSSNVGLITKGAASQAVDLQQWQDSTSAVKAAISATGGFSFSPTTQTTSPAAGGAGALPATPAGYATVTINGQAKLIAYY